MGSKAAGRSHAVYLHCGCSVDPGTLKVIDFGLSKRYKDEQGSVIPRRDGRTGFRGSTAYASVYAHQELEQGTSSTLAFLIRTTLVGICLCDNSDDLARLTS